ncbi:MOSC domain-containing protein [Massilia sp. TWR1-2-2]|uniref:MOSC domain-containing protein n=1 Tax=Massilia sp. TWR1-2-2 TaxID=2804584 RepID=UPI003CEFFDD7
MITLSEIIFYPVKSCAGMSVPHAQLTEAGLEVDGVADREWMVVTDDGQFLTQREHPRMALVTPRLRDGVLVLGAPGQATLAVAVRQAGTGGASREVRLWDDTLVAEDCGDAAANWFSQAIGARCRLVRFPAGARRLTSTRWTGGVAAPTRFADGYPVLVIGAASLADLNDKLVAVGRAALPMDRFRPNLVIDGLGPFEEDYADTFELGGVRLKALKPCPRCPIPSVDQATGVPGADPLDILQAYRRKPQLDGAVCFGMHCIVSAGAGRHLLVGQQVDAELAF